MNPEFHYHLQAAEGFLELGLPHEAAEALEDIEPDLKNRPEVIAVRVGIYEFLKRWEEMAMLVEMLPDEGCELCFRSER